MENRLTNVNGGSSFVYDACMTRRSRVIHGDGSRVKKIAGGETTIYVNRYFEKTGSTATTFYYLGSKLVAQRTGSTLKYIFQDHLGSTSLTTSSSGTSPSTIKYFSFGSTRSGSVSTDIKFTGQRLDGTGLYYYGARYYDPEIGRFISPDTIVPNPMNPQSLNRYSYCLNNPLRYIDPSGHMTIDELYQFLADGIMPPGEGGGNGGGGSGGKDGDNPDWWFYDGENDDYLGPRWEPGKEWPELPKVERDWAQTAKGVAEGTLMLLFVAGGPEWFGLSIGGIGKDSFFFEGYIIEIKPETYSGNNESIINPGNKPNPLENVVYQQRVIDQMAKGDYHAFPREYDSLAVDGQIIHGLDRCGRSETVITARGIYDGKFGTFEWGINYKNELFHRLFRPD